MGSARASSNLVRVDFCFFQLGGIVGEDKKWSMGVSIPLPADCEPTALPSELIPHSVSTQHQKKIYGGTGIRARVKRITTAYANHYTIPPELQF